MANWIEALDKIEIEVLVNLDKVYKITPASNSDRVILYFDNGAKQEILETYSHISRLVQEVEI